MSPWLLRESRANLEHRHFDFAGATSITGGLMLLVYALSQAPQHGWGAASTIGLLVASAAAIGSFVAIELRSPWPLLPMRLFRSRHLSAANGTMALIGAAMFSEFFVLTLYLQDVLGYSAVASGAAFVGFAGTVVVFSNLSQPIVARLNQEIRRVMTDPAVVTRLAGEGAEVLTSTPEEFAADTAAELSKWGRVVHESGAHVD